MVFNLLVQSLLPVLYWFKESPLSLKSAPNCGRLGDPAKSECIWDCDWVNNTFLDSTPRTGSVGLDNVLRGYRYFLLRYPSNPACLADCNILDQIQSSADLIGLIRSTVRPNIDAIVLEICVIYFELNRLDAVANPFTCFPRPSPRAAGGGARMIGNSLTNSYRETDTLENTLRQYPWACSIRTSGYRGRHTCGATLLSAPPDKTVLVSAAHCNYICKDTDGTVLETCCCRDPEDNFASCRTTSSYCGTDGRLRMAEPTDFLIVCGEWSTAEEPELYSREDEVVLVVTKITNHPKYSAQQGPGEGHDIAVYHVDDLKLRAEGVVGEGGVYPACLPDPDQVTVGTRGIFASFKDPFPLYVYYNFDNDRTVKRYRADELILRHTRMDIVECVDPPWMASNSFYPEGSVCALDPSTESCLDTGDSGSGLVMPRGDGSFSWVGTLSFSRGCDRAGTRFSGQSRNIFHGENPGVFSSGLCYLPWIARQYGLAWEGGACGQESGDRNDADKTDCATFTGAKCDFASGFPINDYLNNNPFLPFAVDDPRNLTFTKCILRSVESHVNLVFQCPITSTTLGTCPNNCLGSRSSAIVAGGTALLAGTVVSGFSIAQGLLGLGVVTVGLGTAAMVARDRCRGPLYCRAQETGQCCLLTGSNRGPQCPRAC